MQLERKLSGLTKEVAALEGRRRDLEAAIEAKQRKHTAKLDKALLNNRLELESESRAATAKLERTLTPLHADIDGLEVRKRELRATLVVDEEAVMLQEVGLYQTQHPLTDAAAYSIIKIGMTRRLEPLERVRELGDASVPFRFDVHALFFSDDAVGIEQAMHERLATRRVNHVNHCREFFYATPAEAREHLLQLTGDLLRFEELAEAVEYHQSKARHPKLTVPAARSAIESGLPSATS